MRYGRPALVPRCWVRVESVSRNDLALAGGGRTETWRHRTWIFPSDPQFRLKAATVLDLYGHMFEEHCFKPDEFVLSSEEKTSIQARVHRDNLDAAVATVWWQRRRRDRSIPALSLWWGVKAVAFTVIDDNLGGAVQRLPGPG